MDTASTKQRTRAENASFVIAAVRGRGIEPHAQSRLMQMHRVLTEATRIIQPDDPGFDAALEAERDMTLLGLVFDQSTAHGDDLHFQSLIKHMLNDSVLPQDNRGQSKGRDTQFELFVAAVCQSAGLVPVDYEEPDVTCTVDGIKFGIAAKRVKNISNLNRRVKKAAQQCETAQLPGIVALDTCLALNPENERIATPVPPHQFGSLHSQALTRFLDDYYRKIYDWVDGTGVRGVVFHDHQVRLDPNGQWGLSSMTFWLSTAHDDEQANREFSSFRDSYVRGIPNLEFL